MVIYPAIDLFDGKAVRLFKGDYAQMTVYSEEPAQVARAFRDAGATHMHLVDLQGAKAGRPQNLYAVKRIVDAFDGFVELGGGIRDLTSVRTCFEAGVNRVILGTAAVKDPAFLQAALEAYGEKIAVGVDLKDGYVAVHGWTETSELEADAFFGKLQDLGVKTVICTDISRDGAMQGTNRSLYERLSKNYTMALIASGGVSSMEDVAALAAMGIHGAIVGKAYYVGAIDLKKAIEVAR